MFVYVTSLDDCVPFVSESSLLLITSAQCSRVLERRIAGWKLKLVSCWNPLEAYNQFHVVAVGAYKRVLRSEWSNCWLLARAGGGAGC